MIVFVGKISDNPKNSFSTTLECVLINLIQILWAPEFFVAYLSNPPQKRVIFGRKRYAAFAAPKKLNVCEAHHEIIEFFGRLNGPEFLLPAIVHPVSPRTPELVPDFG
jgi:hypothetical protein